MVRGRFFKGILVAALTLSTTTVVFAAASSDYNQAIKTYLANDFEKALPMFEKLSKAQPKDAKLHYYIALCCQQLSGKDQQAFDEYDKALKNSSDAAFNEILKVRKRKIAGRLGQHVVPLPGSGFEKPDSAAKTGPVRRVIYFSTNWCPSCRGFTPAFDEVASRYKGKIDFIHLNAEDPANWKEVGKYKPKFYPTLVFLDAKNNLIETGVDGSVTGFTKHLQRLGAK